MTENHDLQITETLELGLTVGCVVADARKRSRKTVKEISETLKIAAKYLKGIELDDYSQFPGDAYITGFVKNYANYLGLDGDDIVKQLIKEQFSDKKYHVFNRSGSKVQPIDKKSELSKKYLHSDDGDFSNVGLIVVVGILLLIILIFSIFNRDDEVMVEPPVVLEDVVNVPPDVVSDIKDMVEEELQEAKTEIIEKEKFPVKDEEKSRKVNLVVEEVVEVAPVVYGSEYLSDSELTINVLEDSWLEIYDRDEKEALFSDLFLSGSKVIVPNRDDVVMSTDNAGGISLIFREKEMDLLGKNGETTDYISISSDDLEDGEFKKRDRKKRSGWF